MLRGSQQKQYITPTENVPHPAAYAVKDKPQAAAQIYIPALMSPVPSLTAAGDAVKG